MKLKKINIIGLILLFNYTFLASNTRPESNKNAPIIKLSDSISVAIKLTNKPPILTGGGDVDNNELWMIKDNKEILLISSRDDSDVKKIIGNIHNPKLSYDGKKIYFMSSAWATSDAIHVVDIKTKSEKYICAGNTLEVIMKGKYAGKIIVSQHRYHEAPDYGSYDNYYVYDDNGKQIIEIGEDISKFYEGMN